MKQGTLGRSSPIPALAGVLLLAAALPGQLIGADGRTSHAEAVPASSPDGTPTLRYPGLSPGTAQLHRIRNNLILSNAVLQVRWTVGTEGIRARDLLNFHSQQSLQLKGEMFQIVLADGERYPASRMRPAGDLQTFALTPDPDAAQLTVRMPGQMAQLPLRSVDGKLRVTWRAMLRDEANAVRQEIAISAVEEECVIRELVWMEEEIPGARAEGKVDGSPIVTGTFFLGAENPHARNELVPVLSAGGRDRVVCRVPRDTALQPGKSLRQSFVIGVSPPGQMRRAFLHYLEHERAHPYRQFLHYNSWYDIAWTPFALNESNCLEAIHLWGEGFIQKYGITLEALVFDDGWDDPHSLWQFHSGFPNGFEPLAEACRAYGTGLGVWLSPFGGYGKPKQQRLKFGQTQGYETNATGFSLAGPKYYAAFKAACVNMIRSYGVNHFKFDGIAAGMYADGSEEYLLDTEAMRRLMSELRQEDPAVYLNLTTGSWPSPFWLRYADSIWRQGGDMGLSGRGSRQQQWLTYRDQETYRNIVLKGPLYPLNSLMTQGVAYSRQGSAGDPSFNSAGFKDDVRAFFASGTGLQELYIQPDKLTSDDWRVLAEAARWSRDHADVLVDTHWIGGDPGQLEVYGWAAWSGQRGTVALRNPDETPQSFELEIGAALELPPSAPRAFHLQSPWEEDAGQARLAAEVDTSLRLHLEPFEVLVLEAAPRPRRSPG
jgi:hypothetical protein